MLPVLELVTIVFFQYLYCVGMRGKRNGVCMCQAILLHYPECLTHTAVFILLAHVVPVLF